MWLDETGKKKKSLRKGEKNQASCGKPYKPGLISQTITH
jgi:hypothetical protein